MAYTIKSLSERDHAIYVNGEYVGAVTRFDDGIARGKPHETYWLSSQGSYDSYYLTMDRAIQPMVRHHYRAVARAQTAGRNAAAAYRAGSSLG